MNKRSFITLLGGTAAWPLAARAQRERMRRIAVLMGRDENDPMAKTIVSAFIQGASREPALSSRRIYSWVVHRAPIISAAARNNVAAVYTQSEFARDGGLLSYGVDQVDAWRRAASYAIAFCAAQSRAISPCSFR